MEDKDKHQAEAIAPVRSFVVAQTSIAARPLEAALYLVATPIGNLSDITIRALETLAGADIVACEDTRVTRVLLDRYGIRQRSTPYHEHNADEAGPRLIAALSAGKSVALVSDAVSAASTAEAPGIGTTLMSAASARSTRR